MRPYTDSFRVGKIFLGLFLHTLALFIHTLIHICKQAIHICKFVQLNGLWGCLRYPHYVHNQLSLRGLGCGKKDLYIWKIFRIFKGEEGGVSLLLTILWSEIDLEVSGIFRIFVFESKVYL